MFCCKTVVLMRNIILLFKDEIKKWKSDSFSTSNSTLKIKVIIFSIMKNAIFKHFI